MFIDFIERMVGFYTEEELAICKAWKKKLKLCEHYLADIYEDVEKPWLKDELSEAEKYKLFLKHYANYKRCKQGISNRVKSEVFASCAPTEIPVYDKSIVSKYVWQVRPML